MLLEAKGGGKTDFFCCFFLSQKPKLLAIILAVFNLCKMKNIFPNFCQSTICDLQLFSINGVKHIDHNFCKNVSSKTHLWRGRRNKGHVSTGSLRFGSPQHSSARYGCDYTALDTMRLWAESTLYSGTKCCLAICCEAYNETITLRTAALAVTTLAELLKLLKVSVLGVASSCHNCCYFC